MNDSIDDLNRSMRRSSIPMTESISNISFTSRSSNGHDERVQTIQDLLNSRQSYMETLNKEIKETQTKSNTTFKNVINVACYVTIGLALGNEIIT